MQDVARAGTQRDANTKLPFSLGDRVGDDSIDAERGQSLLGLVLARELPGLQVLLGDAGEAQEVVGVRAQAALLGDLGPQAAAATRRVDCTDRLRTGAASAASWAWTRATCAR